MRAVQSLFLSGENETEVVELAERGDIGSQFYAKLYLSLYYESLGNAGQAGKWMSQAIATDYAKSIGAKDPMVDLAKMAVGKRGWSSLVMK